MAKSNQILLNHFFDSIERNDEKEILSCIQIYGIEFYNLDTPFGFIDKIIEDDIFSKLKSEENKKVFKEKVIHVFNQISRKIFKKIDESKDDIQNWSEIGNGEVNDFYYDKKTNKYLSRLDTYKTKDIFNYYNRILNETLDFSVKEEVLDIFHTKYLLELSHEASIESIYCENIDELLDLFNNPKYKEVRESSIVPALTDKMAEQFTISELKFKTIEEAQKAYEEDKTQENLAQLKKLYMIQITKDTEGCNDHEELGKMLSEATLQCVKRIIIRRLAYLDVQRDKE